MSTFSFTNDEVSRFISFPLLFSLQVQLTLSARPPVLCGERGAIRGGDEGGGSFSPVGWRGASAPAIAAPFAPAPAAPLLLPRLPFHSPRLRLSADAELPFPCDGGSGGQAPSESCGDEAIFFLGACAFQRKKKGRRSRKFGATDAQQSKREK